MLRHLAPFVSDLVQHRELLWQFTVRNVELRHKGSHLGLLWSLLNPLLMLGLYVLVFGFILNGHFGVVPGESKMDYAIAVFLSLTLFHLVAETAASAPALIAGNPNFVKKVVFPLDVLPASGVLSAAIHAGITLAMVFAAQCICGTGMAVTWLWFPLILAALLGLALGVALFVSAVGVFFRDIGVAMPVLTTATMFASAVFYSAEKIPPPVWAFLRFNPFLHAVEQSRRVIVWHLPPEPGSLTFLCAAAVLVLWSGAAVFRRLRSVFADVL